MPAYRLLPVVGLAALLGVACTEGPPTSVPDGDAPRFSHKPGHDPDGGGMPEGDPSITLEFVDDAANNIQSDARGQDVDGECGVQATFNLTDARLDPHANRIHPRATNVCGGRDARRVRVAFISPDERQSPGPRAMQRPRLGSDGERAAIIGPSFLDPPSSYGLWFTTYEPDTRRSRFDHAMVTPSRAA